MAIAFDATAQGSINPGTSVTFSHTCTGSNLILLVGVSVYATSSDFITGITYGGVSMTRIGTINNVPNTHVEYLYYLIAPATGANNVVASSSSSKTIECISQSYTGVKQSAQPDSFNTGNADIVSSITISTTTVADNSWLVSVCGVTNVGLAAAGTGTTRRNTSGGTTSMGDSNGAKSPAGSYSMQWTQGAGESFASVMASIAPYVASTVNSNFFMFM